VDLTVNNLKIGAKLILGNYGVQNESPQPIVWLKASPNCAFITESVLDYICFDAKEPQSPEQSIRYGGNPQYNLSNIFSFLNSDAEEWFHPTHENDAAPVRHNGQRGLEYESHYGFLYHFEEYENESLMCTTYAVDGEQVSSKIRLPSKEEILGAERFKLFSKKGIRPRGTYDMLTGRRAGFEESSYIDYWLCDKHASTFKVKTISRSGEIRKVSPQNPCGLRPVCCINPDTKLVIAGDGVYRIEPYVIRHNVYTDEELFGFLGMAQP